MDPRLEQTNILKQFPPSGTQLKLDDLYDSTEDSWDQGDEKSALQPKK